MRRTERGLLWSGLPGTGGGRQRLAHLRLRSGLARHVSDLFLWDRGAEAEVAATDGTGRSDWLLWVNRADFGQRPGEYADHSAAGWECLCVEWHQDVDHQWQYRRSGGCLGPCG